MSALDEHLVSRTVKVQQAKTRLSAILREVENGAEYTIARGDTPVARLVPMEPTRSRRPMGFVPYELPDEFFDELPADELDAWEKNE